MPYQDARGTWISDDGRSYWNGSAWLPVQPPAVQPLSQPPPQPVGQPFGQPAYAYGAGISVAGAAPGGAKAAWSLGLGIFAMIAWLLPLVGLPVSITGLVLGALARSGPRRSMATWGLVLSAIALVLALINASAGAYLAIHRQV